MQIRQAIPNDAELIASIQQQVWASQRIEIEQVIQGLADPHNITLVSVNESNGILGFASGFLTISAQDIPRWEIDLVAVIPSAQGQGVGSQLVTALTAQGESKNTQLARALIQVDNQRMHRTLTRLRYACQLDIVHLFISEPATNGATPKPVNLHIVPVNTLSYKGVWIEEDWSLASFSYSQTQLNSDEIAGTLVASHDVTGIEHAQKSGFSKIDDYQWWTRNY